MHPAANLLAVGRTWWLPTNYAVHGRETDALLGWFFWITMGVLVGVEGTLVAFLLRYRVRRGDGRRPRFTHGNRVVEVTWTLVPAVILAGLAMASKRVWDDYRNSPDLNDPGRSKVLVIGQQFAWSVVYPGPDGRFGRYGVFPRTTDARWPVGVDGRPFRFKGVPGPASLPPDKAARAIDDYIDQVNPLGKDFADPAGRDDDWGQVPGQTAYMVGNRPIYVPVNRPVEVDLMSKDVIHDFYLPSFRAQLYAVPGMIGRFVFTPIVTTAELERATRRTVPVGQVPPDAVADVERRSDLAVRDGQPVTAAAAAVAANLRATGIESIPVRMPSPFEVVCAQLCGVGHSQMRGELVVLSQAEFDRRFPAAPHGVSR